MTIPTLDPIGTVRREDHPECAGYSIWVLVGQPDVAWDTDAHEYRTVMGTPLWLCIQSTAPGNVAVCLDAVPHSFPIIGAVPGTEAARREVAS